MIIPISVRIGNDIVIPVGQLCYRIREVVTDIVRITECPDCTVRIKNVEISDITVEGTGALAAEIVLAGADAEHMVSGVVFKNVLRNGKPIGIDDITANEYVEGITICGG